MCKNKPVDLSEGHTNEIKEKQFQQKEAPFKMYNPWSFVNYSLDEIVFADNNWEQTSLIFRFYGTV